MLFFYASFLASILLMCVIMFPFWLSWYFSVFIITSQRFIEITQKGFFRRHVSDVPLNLIQSVNYEIVGIEQTLLGFGTLIVQTFIGESKLHHIHHPAKVQRKIAELMKIEGITPSPNATVLRRIEEEEGKEYD
ncbi:MAG: hypothetical protein QG629_374 [Patescibacteria group bacterium]|nr:hypothetical protein [Patescibacteria group bacterium]